MASHDNTPSSAGSGWRPAGPVGVAAVIVAACAVAGVLAGAVWLVVAPRARYLLDGHGHALLADVESPALMAADGWFVVITGSVCFLLAAVAYPVFGRRRPVAVLAGLAVGGVVCSLVAWLLARAVWIGGFHHAVHTGGSGQRVAGYLTVHAHGALLVGAFFAVAAFGLIEALGGAVWAPGGGAADPETPSPYGPVTGEGPGGAIGPAGPVAPSGPDAPR